MTTHVLDTARGRGAAKMRVDLWRAGEELARIELDDGGRGTLLEQVEAGAYELLFYAGDYQGSGRFGAEFSRERFFDVIPIRFVVAEVGQHYHIPLILSPFGYSTYRGG